MNQLYQFLYEEITYAQRIQKDPVNKKLISALNYKLRDYVFVDAKIFRFKQLSKKLEFKSSAFIL